MTDGTPIGVCRYLMQRYEHAYPQSVMQATRNVCVLSNHTVLIIWHHQGGPSYHVIQGTVTPVALQNETVPHRNHVERDVRDWYVERSRFPVVHLLPVPPRVKCRMCVGMGET